MQGVAEMGILYQEILCYLHPDGEEILMKKSLLVKLLVVAQVLLVLLVVIAASPGTAAVTAQEVCESGGGSWSSGSLSAETGYCTYPAGNPLVSGYCASGSILYLDYVDGHLDGTTCKGIWPEKGDNADGCWLIGGEFDDTDPDLVTCTVTHTEFGDCPATTVYRYETDKSHFVMTFACEGGAPTSTGGGGSGAPARTPGYGKTGNGFSDDGTGSARLGGGKNGTLYYNPGTCAGSCSISANLPKGAKGSLPAGTKATLYVRVVDADGNPASGGYTACFDPGKLTSPVIYRYVSGAWVAQAVFFSGGQVCTTASGDGSFALGGK